MFRDKQETGNILLLGLRSRSYLLGGWFRKEALPDHWLVLWDTHIHTHTHTYVSSLHLAKRWESVSIWGLDLLCPHHGVDAFLCVAGSLVLCSLLGAPASPSEFWAAKHVRCSVSLIIRKMQIEMTVRCQYLHQINKLLGETVPRAAGSKCACTMPAGGELLQPFWVVVSLPVVFNSLRPHGQ